MRTQGSNSLLNPTEFKDDPIQREVLVFLQALHTYPDRFAQQPNLSFEQYLLEIAAVSVAPGPPQAFRQAAGAS
jgi:hypothetical protein